MKIFSWVGNLMAYCWNGKNNPTPIKQQPVTLNFRHYPELRDLRRNGATQEQLVACQKGFELLESYGQATSIDHVAERCLPIILETGKATPEHILTFFAIFTAHKAHVPLSKQESIGIARDIAGAINRGLTAKEIANDVLSIYSS